MAVNRWRFVNTLSKTLTRGGKIPLAPSAPLSLSKKLKIPKKIAKKVFACNLKFKPHI